MSDPAASAQRQHNQRQGLIATIVSLPFRLFGVLVASLFLSILIECVGMHFFWPEQGWRHAADMLDYELMMGAVRAIDVPMMLVRGRMSDVVSEEGVARFLTEFPHVEFVDVTGAGHMVAGDRNDVFTEAVVSFLERLEHGS